MTPDQEFEKELKALLAKHNKAIIAVSIPKVVDVPKEEKKD